MSVENPQDLSEMKEWRAAHDAKIDAYWAEQRRWNDKVDAKFNIIYTRLSALEKRVILITGLSAAAGSLLGYIFQGLIHKGGI